MSESSRTIAGTGLNGLPAVHVRASNYDGAHHWSHPARLVEAGSGLVITGTSAGLEVVREGGVYVSPFNTRGHYWADRWFNVIRLEDPEQGLVGWYCNVASPVDFDGESVRYVDLQLDVRFTVTEGDLTYRLLDEDEFAAARERYSYPDDLVARCRAAVDEIIALGIARQFPFDR